jgi:hypothetical protein
MVVAVPISEDRFDRLVRRYRSPCMATAEISIGEGTLAMSRTSSPVFPLGFLGMFLLLIGSTPLALHALFCDLRRRRWRRR